MPAPVNLVNHTRTGRCPLCPADEEPYTSDAKWLDHVVTEHPRWETAEALLRAEATVGVLLLQSGEHYDAILSVSPLIQAHPTTPQQST